MNPELPAPQLNPEASPQHKPQRHEDSASFDTNEAMGERGYEREQSMHQVDRENTPPIQAPVVPLPPAHVPVPVPQRAASDESAGPTIASDDDLIEKEWVDKAKNIVANTQNDPYKREQEVSKLQIDYLRKRYGKELGTSN